MDTVKIAVTGLGYFGALELDVLANMPGVEVSAIVSRSEERTRELMERYNITNAFQSTDEMLEKVKLDAILIATEDERHFEPTIAALQAGIDVFLEKPISHDLNEAREMIDEAARLNRKFMVGHILRHDVSYAAVKSRIASGEMGRLNAVYGRRNMCRLLIEQYLPNLFYTTGIHDIDIILWFYEGIKPAEVYMKTVDTFGGGADVFWGMITMEDGSLGIVETNWALPEATPWRGHIVMEAIGSKATAHINMPGNGLQFWTDEQVDVPDTVYWPALHGVTVGALRNELAYFIRCLKEDKPITLPHPEDAYISLRVAEALIRSSKEGKPILL
jgi:UDP-N-acetylglucosamine 3-dehydrogenase